MTAPQRHLSHAVGRAAVQDGPPPGSNWRQTTRRPRSAPLDRRATGLPAAARMRETKEYRRRPPGEEQDRRRYALDEHTDISPSGCVTPEGFGRSASGRTVKGCDRHSSSRLHVAERSRRCRRRLGAVYVGAKHVPANSGLSLDRQNMLRGKGLTFVQPFPHGRLRNGQQSSERRLRPDVIHRGRERGLRRFVSNQRRGHPRSFPYPKL